MMMMILRLTMFHILQWNARSLVANGQEFKTFVDAFKEKTGYICVLYCKRRG